MVRRGQQGLQKLRRAERDAAAQLGSPNGAYRADRSGCRKREWETPYDDANSVRLHFILWHRGKTLVDFIVNVQVLASDGWDTVEYFDCCHGHSHLHPKNPDLEPRTIAQLDTADDVKNAFVQVEQEAHERARIIRDEGVMQMVNPQLDAFRREVNINLACGALLDLDLPVTSDEGGYPVVVALEEERLSALLGRIRAVGGFANLFVRGPSQIRMVSVIGDSCAIPIPDDVMVGDEAPGPNSTVGMFIDYVERKPNGVTISAAVGHPACARDSRVVELA